MQAELATKLAAAVDKMPAFPKSVQRIIELTRDINADARELVDVIDKDPVVTVKILKVVNSSYFNLPRQVTSVANAVAFLGFNTLKNLSLSIAAVGMLSPSNQAGFDMQQYLLHSLSTAGIAKKLATRLAQADPMDCFIAGLLHDFGKVVLAQHMHEAFKLALEQSRTHNLSLHETLQQTLGAHHTEVGAMLVEKWRFPDSLVQAIRMQTPGGDLASGMAIAIFAANQLSKKLSMGFAGNPCVHALPPAAEAALGMNLDILAASEDWGVVFDEAKVFANL
ncbi:HDOD domain-containing protein [Curvibacter sp. CHRR-16]|uniref:HDOD domain-containing protein n=1 Tax=Curvibacter sp. CHRR-16 TaxID=2835872 RepID=UPI001BD9E3FE|nr:HDOD domain-containing protein [Curvibacter sp. CHRR-16]MBT0570868.1 HDOD domain-containing protein [Curvibacter sp. CHRR-16]